MMNFTDMTNEAVRKNTFQYVEVLEFYLVLAETNENGIRVYHYFNKDNGEYIKTKVS
jgi:hypothetical protein